MAIRDDWVFQRHLRKSDGSGLNSDDKFMDSNVLSIFKQLSFSVIFLTTLFISGNGLLILLKPRREHLPVDLQIPLAITLGLNLIPLLLLWTSTFGLRLSSGFAVGYVGLAILVNFVWLASKREKGSDDWISTKELWQKQAVRNLTWLSIIFFLTWLSRFIAVHGFLVAPGSDSYHHTLIATLIAEQGQIPESYEPYAPPTTFTYHFGFHALTAFMYWLTGLPLTKLVLWVGQGLNSLVVLSMYFLVRRLTNQSSTALIAAFLVGLVAVFPAYMANWGRLTQLSGLVILPVTMGLILNNKHPHLWRIGPLLVAAIFLYHYRVFAMLGMLFVAVGIIRGWLEFRQVRTSGLKRERLQPLLYLAWLAGVGFILVVPWLIESGFISRLLEHNARLSVVSQSNQLRSYYSLDRLGDALFFYSNYWLLLMGVIGLVNGFLNMRSITLALILWVALLLLWSNPYWFPLPGAGILDVNSVMISLFVPVCFFAALGISHLGSEFSPPDIQLQFTQRIRWGKVFALLGFTLFAVVQITNVIKPDDLYVRANDMQAMNWIKEHTDPHARFLVNPVVFEWRAQPGGSVVGSDAGYWIPLLTQRQANTLPMIVVNENISREILEERTELSRIAINPTPASLAKLRAANITHIFVGEKGGPLPLDFLENTPCATNVWQQGQTNIFALNYGCLE